MYKETGSCVIDVDLTVEKWDSLFFIAQYGGGYRLVKHRRMGSPYTDLKCCISKDQFLELKGRLKLVETKNRVFKGTSSWRSMIN